MSASNADSHQLRVLSSYSPASLSYQARIFVAASRKRGQLLHAEAFARKLEPLSVGDALAFVLPLADHEPARFDRAGGGGTPGS